MNKEAVVEAAIAWAKARRTVLELPIKSPGWLPCLIELSNAEHNLREAVEKKDA